MHAVEFFRWIERYRARIGNGKPVPKTARPTLEGFQSILENEVSWLGT